MDDRSAEKAKGEDRGRRFSDSLARVAGALATERVDLGTIIQFMGRRSIGGLLFILALPMALPVPMPGISVIFGVPLILVSAQLFLGFRRVWLPPQLAKRSISSADFITFINRALPTVRLLEKITRPRIKWLAGDWAMVPVGVVCLLLAIVITLPVPLGHVVPGTAISVLALGLIERDGLAIGLGVLTAILGLIIVAMVSTNLIEALRASLLYWSPSLDHLVSR